MYDAAARNSESSMKFLLAVIATFALSAGVGDSVSWAADPEYNVEGKYKRIKPARPLEQSDKVEVVDVFWYGCPHCFTFLPHLQQWEHGKPEYVEMRRLPAIFRQSWVAHARAYYTAKLLNVEEQLHTAVFNALHGEKRQLNTREELRSFFAEHGVDTADFDSTYDSFSVDAMARESEVMARRWGV